MSKDGNEFVSKVAYTLDTGEVNVTVNTRDMYENTNFRISGIAVDIYKNLPDFKDDLYFVRKVKPFKGYKVEDVLDEFTKNYGEDKFIFAQAGSISCDMEAGGIIDDAIGVINSQRMDLFRSYFYNIIFNRVMHNSYGNGEIFIYSNDTVEDFIAKNMGSVTSDKIINRVISEGLVK